MLKKNIFFKITTKINNWLDSGNIQHQKNMLKYKTMQEEMRQKYPELFKDKEQ